MAGFGTLVQSARQGKGLTLRLIEDEMNSTADPAYRKALEVEHKEIKSRPISEFAAIESICKATAQEAILRAKQAAKRSKR